MNAREKMSVYHFEIAHADLENMQWDTHKPEREE